MTLSVMHMVWCGSLNFFLKLLLSFYAYSRLSLNVLSFTLFYYLLICYVVTPSTMHMVWCGNLNFFLELFACLRLAWCCISLCMKNVFGSVKFILHSFQVDKVNSCYVVMLAKSSCAVLSSCSIF